MAKHKQFTSPRDIYKRLHNKKAFQLDTNRPLINRICFMINTFETFFWEGVLVQWGPSWTSLKMFGGPCTVRCQGGRVRARRVLVQWGPVSEKSGSGQLGPCVVKSNTSWVMVTWDNNFSSIICVKVGNILSWRISLESMLWTVMYLLNYFNFSNSLLKKLQTLHVFLTRSYVVLVLVVSCSWRCRTFQRKYRTIMWAAVQFFEPINLFRTQKYFYHYLRET